MNDHVRIFCCVALTLLAALCLYAQPAPDELGALHGIVTTKEGALVADLPVMVNSDTIALVFTTGPDGEYGGPLPPGTVKVSPVSMPPAQITIKAGEVTELDFTLATSGVLLTITDTAGIPIMVNLRAGYRAGNAPPVAVKPTPVQRGVYWCPGVADDATTFVVMYWRTDLNVSAATRQVWTFADQSPYHHFNLTSPVVTPTFLTARDAAGQPLANTLLTIRLTIPATNGPGNEPDAALWGAISLEPDATPEQTQTLAITTNAAGMFAIPAVSPGHYGLLVFTASIAAAPLNLDAGANGALPLDTVILRPFTRTVKQVFRNADGTALKLRTVHASYAWEGTATILTAMTDEAGRVEWTGLPPTRLTTWGPGVPPGDIADDADSADGNLPAPHGTAARTVHFLPLGFGDAPAEISWIFRAGPAGSGMPDITGVTKATPGQDNTGMRDFVAPVGTPVSLVAVTYTTPPRAAFLTDIYLPESDAPDAQLLVPVQLTEFPTVHGHFVGADGAPVAGLTNLVITPTDPASLPLLNPSSGSAHLPFMQPVWQPDGTFTATLPGPGSYQLTMDMDVVAGLSPGGVAFTADTGAQDITITLPSPLLTVPAGTEVAWITRDKPTEPLRLTAAAYADQTPIFGSEVDLLALWYSPSPNKLVLRTFGPDGVTQTLPLRDVQVNIAPTANGRPELLALRLAALLPASAAEQASADSAHRRESQDVAFTDTAPCSLMLWAGSYDYGDLAYHALQSVTVPATGPAALTLSADAVARGTGVSPVLTSPQVQFKFPIYMPPAGTPPPTSDRVFLYSAGDMRFLQAVNAPRTNGQNTADVSLPGDVTRVTLVWLGVGTVRDLALPAPPAGGGSTRVTVPAWTPGVSIEGVCRDADGKPIVGGQLQLSPEASHVGGALTIRTDDKGHFVVNGLPVGRLYVRQWQQNLTEWVLDIPEGGLKNLVLRQEKTPVTVRFPGMDQSEMVWWLPDTGAPQRIMLDNGDAVTLPGIAQGPGLLWGMRPAEADIQSLHSPLGTPVSAPLLPTLPPLQVLRTTLAPGVNTVTLKADGASMGLIVPLIPGDGIPSGTVTLTGEGNRTGFQETLNGVVWEPCALLGSALATLSAMPPGTYTVQITAAAGPLTAHVTVTDTGGCATFTLPVKPPLP